MPRIDPTKLLGTLKPLLDVETGGIRTQKDADKIYHLMVKFSKKLVSKCTYLNILLATPEDVLNAFMEQGGWDMLYDWLTDANNNKHYSVIDEILKLLIKSPASVERLRKNSLPKDVKQLTKVDVEGTKLLAEKVVSKWIAIAKSQDRSRLVPVQVVNPQEPTQQVAEQQLLQHDIHQFSQQSLQPPHSHILNQDNVYQVINSNASEILNPMINNISGENICGQQQESMVMSDDMVMRSNMPEMYDGEGHGNNMDMDVDLSNVDFTDALDFNPDLFSQAIEQHLPELNSSDPEKLGISEADSFQQSASLPPQPVILQSQPQQPNPMQQQYVAIPTTASAQQIILQTSSSSPVVTNAQSTPSVTRIVIKKVSGGKPAMMFQTSPAAQNPQNPQATQPNHVLQLVTHNGRQFLMRVLPESSAANVSAQGAAETNPIQHMVQSPATTTESSPQQNNEGKKPGILSRKAPAAKAAAGPEQKSPPKTYSKKTSQDSPSGSMEVVDVASTKAAADEKVGKRSSTSSKSSPSTKSKSDSASGSITRRSSSKSASTAAKEKEEKEKAEKLRQKAKEAKKIMKERLKEKESERKKSEQKQKDDATLKEVFGATSAIAPTKIPKKSKPSFTDLIGVPGAKEEVTKREKVHKDSEKDKSKSSKDGAKATEAKEGEKEASPPKERRHRVKVYVSSKSKNMDLVESMVKDFKNLPKTDTPEGSGAENSEKAADKPAGASFEDALLGGGRSSKPTKRPSIDSTKSGGDSKKAKLEDSSKKDVKSKDKAKDDKDKPKEKTPPKKQIQESSLFMDALNATTRETKGGAKKRRRASSSDQKSENGVMEPLTAPETENPPADQQPDPTPSPEKVMKPVFNFYRETLDDDDDDKSAIADALTSEDTKPVIDEDAKVNTAEKPEDEAMDTGETKVKDAFAPADDEAIQLKSCLCIHRPKGREKKLVRWREEEEIKEVFFFEMDETERVNVTKQTPDFTQLKQMERSSEKLMRNNKMSMDNEGEERFPWHKPRPINLPPSTLALDVRSEEKEIQDQREQNILQVFYFPGAQIPDCPSEVGVSSQEYDHSHAPRAIPHEDVPVLTKVYDCRDKPWPNPAFASRITKPNVPAIDSLPNPQLTAAALAAQLGLQAQALQPPPADSFNPWTQTLEASKQQAPDPWKMAAETQGFQLPIPGFPLNIGGNNFNLPFGFPPNPAALNAAQMQMGQVPGQAGLFPGFGNMMPGIQTSPPDNSQGPPHMGGGNRFQGRKDHNEYQDGRRNDRERDRGDRDMRDNRNRDRPPFNSRERDYGGRDYGSGRGRDGRDRGGHRSDRGRGDYERGDRDYRFSERGHLRRPAGRRAVLCNYFAKGHCREGDKCQFLHPGVNGPPLGEGNNGSSNYQGHSRGRGRPSGPSRFSSHEERRDTPGYHKRDDYSHSANHNSNSDETPASPDREEIPEIASPTPEYDDTKFDQPPSSPNEFPTSASLPSNETRVIPAYTDEDWG